MLLLTTAEFQTKGLSYFRIPALRRKSEKQKKDLFRKLYGSAPLDLSEMWFDLTNSEVLEVRLEGKEKSEKGLTMFFAAHYFLWMYPKNSHSLAVQFRICERYSRGEPLWKWIRRIAALKVNRIVWNPRLDSPDGEIFNVTVDGVDFKVWEKQHPLLPVDPRQCSHKFKHGALKYEVAVSVFESKCVWISGPHRGGLGDMEIFRSGLKQMIKENKLVIADRGYRSKNADERQILSIPDRLDPPELYNFKTRARCRHESFNGRLKDFRIMSDTFRHGETKHKLAFEAVAVIIQYQMDNGACLFAV